MRHECRSGALMEAMQMKSRHVVLVSAAAFAGLILGCQEKKQPPVEAAPAPEVQAPPKYPYETIKEPENTTPPPAAAEATPTTPDPAVKEVEPEPARKATKAKPKEHYAQPDKKAGRAYTVKKGDTLQEISQKFYGTTKNWNKIYKANTKVIKDPDKLQVGTKLVIP